MDESGTEYFPTPRKAILQESTTFIVERPENCICFAELQALTCFMEEVSAQRPCTTEGCLGSLMLVSVDRVGLGGGARIQFACSCSVLSKLEAWKPFTCANIYAVRAVRSRCLPFSTNFAFRNVRASSNVKLALAIPFARAAITIWTIN